jgi:hypothetical protein
MRKMLVVLIIPRMELKLNTRRGTKLNGVRIKPPMIFQVVLLTDGISEDSESANSTSRATHAAISSRENKTETTILAV